MINDRIKISFHHAFVLVNHERGIVVKDKNIDDVYFSDDSLEDGYNLVRERDAAVILSKVSMENQTWTLENVNDKTLLRCWKNYPGEVLWEGVVYHTNIDLATLIR